MPDKALNGNDQAQLLDYRGGLLNHVSLIYRPGERHLAAKLFNAVGCEVHDRGELYLYISIVPGNPDLTNNVLFAGEATPEQWRFDQELQNALASDTPMAQAYAAFVQRYRRMPARASHFGIRYPSFALLEQTLENFQTRLDPELKGRVEVAGVFRPNESGSFSDRVMQVFLKTDIVATGSLAIGSNIELQAQAWQ
jgi:hypothetical protein